jgi:hypothetical protein
MTRTGRRVVVSIVALISLIPVSFALSVFINSVSLSSRSESIAASGFLLSSNLPVTVTVFGRSTDTISARINFNDADGSPFSMLERSWSGWELSFDFILVRSGNGWLAFPFSVSTDATGSGNGVDLIKYYDNEGFPAIFESSRLDADGRKALRRMFSIIKTERWLPRIFGTLHHERLKIRSFDAGNPYIISVDANGKLSLRH